MCTGVLTPSDVRGRSRGFSLRAHRILRPTLWAQWCVCAGDTGQAEAELRLRCKRSVCLASPVLNKAGLCMFLE